MNLWVSMRNCFCNWVNCHYKAQGRLWEYWHWKQWTAVWM